MHSHLSTQASSPSHWQQHILIILIAAALYFPFINQAINVDSDLFMHMAAQLSHHPVNPPLGEYGRHLVQHEKTLMPQSSVYYRCSHPPLLPLLFCGNSEWPYHTGLFLFYLLTIYGAWFFFGLWLTVKQRFCATLLWTVCPALVINSHTLMWDMPITALVLWSFALGVKANRSNSVRMAIYSGLIAGIAALVKSNCIPLFIIIPFLYVSSGKWKLCASDFVDYTQPDFLWQSSIFFNEPFSSDFRRHPVSHRTIHRLSWRMRHAASVLVLVDICYKTKT